MDEEETEDSRLLPCPHCGDYASITCNPGIFHGVPGWRVECEGRCHAMTCYWHSEQDAIEKWNWRIN
jgi:hypothetical protein